VIEDQVMVQGRITLTRYNLREKNPALHATDVSIIAGLGIQRAVGRVGQ